MFTSLLSGTIGEILAPSPSVSTEKKRPSSEQEQQEQQQQEASGQDERTFSTPQQEEDAAAHASVNKTLADASTLFPFPEVENRGHPPPLPPGVITTAAMTDPAAADVTGMLASLSLADQEKEREQQQHHRRQSAAAVLMPPPPPPSMSNSSSLASLRPTPPTPEVTPPSSTTEKEGDGGRGDSINSNLLPAFATPSKQTPGTGRKGSAARRRFTVSPMLTRTPKKMEPRLGDMVLKAAVDTAACLTSPISDWKKQKAIFDACALSRATPEHNKIQALASSLASEPSLAKTRSTRLAMLAPDGQTPLHCAAAMNNVIALNLLLLAPETDCFAVDLQGRTALHLAATNGHLEACRLLKHEMTRRAEGGGEGGREGGQAPVGAAAPVDLSGRTPLGWRVSAAGERKELEEELFALGDPSIFPSVPLQGRAGGGRLGFGYCSTPGWQPKMEDTVCVQTPLLGGGGGGGGGEGGREGGGEGGGGGEEDDGLFAVFDGHQGLLCAEFAADHLADTLLETRAWRRGRAGRRAGVQEEEEEEEGGWVREALIETCLSLDRKLAELPDFQMKEEHTMGVGSMAHKVLSTKLVSADSSGSTAVICLVTPSLVACANLGDSRAVLLARKEGSRDNDDPSAPPSLHALPLSFDHKPELDSEKQRVEAAGGLVKGTSVAPDKDSAPVLIWRVYPREGTADSLAMTRALGDFAYKRKPGLGLEEQMIIPLPDVHLHPRGASDEFLVLACDGVWDVFSNDEIAVFVEAHVNAAREDGMRKPTYLAELADDIVKESMRRGSRDNITALVVRLRAPDEGERRALFM